MFLVCGHKEICFPVLLFFDDLGGNTSHVLKCFCPLVTCLTSMQQNSTKEVAPEKTNKRNMSCFVKQQKLFLSDLLNVNTEMLLESLKKLENALIWSANNKNFLHLSWLFILKFWVNLFDHSAQKKSTSIDVIVQLHGVWEVLDLHETTFSKMKSPCKDASQLDACLQETMHSRDQQAWLDAHLHVWSCKAQTSMWDIVMWNVGSMTESITISRTSSRQQERDWHDLDIGHQSLMSSSG